MLTLPKIVGYIVYEEYDKETVLIEWRPRTYRMTKITF